MTLYFVFFYSTNKQKNHPTKSGLLFPQCTIMCVRPQQDALSKVNVFVKPVMCLLYLRISALVLSLPRGRFSSKFLEVL